MMRRFNRLLVLFYVISDAGLGMAAFALAYYLRFHGIVAQLIPPVKGVPPFRWYVYMMPFVAVLVPAAFHVQGLYRLRRSRTRLDDFLPLNERALLPDAGKVSRDADAVMAAASSGRPSSITRLSVCTTGSSATG